MTNRYTARKCHSVSRAAGRVRKNVDSDTGLKGARRESGRSLVSNGLTNLLHWFVST